MIETVMIFALGFLAAALCALLLLPAVNARAIRLSRRRIEARLPLSVAEVAAEKDHLRAEFAVTRRRLERRVEAVQAARHADLATIGARTLEAAALARQVETGTATLQTREAEIVETRTALAGVERDLVTARAEGEVGLATLQVLEGAHRELLDDLVRRHHAAPEPIDLTARCAALAAERETLRASLAAAEEALAQAVARTAPQAATGQDSDTAALRLRITEVADSLMRRERLPAVEAYPLMRS